MLKRTLNYLSAPSWLASKSNAPKRWRNEARITALSPSSRRLPGTRLAPCRLAALRPGALLRYTHLQGGEPGRGKAQREGEGRFSVVKIPLSRHCRLQPNLISEAIWTDFRRNAEPSTSFPLGRGKKRTPISYQNPKRNPSPHPLPRHSLWMGWKWTADACVCILQFDQGSHLSAIKSETFSSLPYVGDYDNCKVEERS